MDEPMYPRRVPARTGIAQLAISNSVNGIWNLVADYFPDSEHLVDWYHACEHLAQASAALYPDDPQRAHSWHKGRRANLFLAEIRLITGPLDWAGLCDQSGYFDNHQQRMCYQEFREEGNPIGLGTVEIGIKQFMLRLTKPVTRWSRTGVDRMISVRGAVMGDNFDELWARA